MKRVRSFATVLWILCLLWLVFAVLILFHHKLTLDHRSQLAADSTEGEPDPAQPLNEDDRRLVEGLQEAVARHMTLDDVVDLVGEGFFLNVREEGDWFYDEKYGPDWMTFYGSESEIRRVYDSDVMALWFRPGGTTKFTGICWSGNRPSIFFGALVSCSDFKPPHPRPKKTRT